MEHRKAKELLEKYRNGTLTEEERALLESWYLDWPAGEGPGLSENELQEDLAAMRKANLFITPARTVKLWPRIAAAASVLLLLSFGGWFLLRQPATVQQTADHIKPGHSQATLTLADGRKIILTRGLKGQLAMQGNVSISADTSAITYTGTEEKTEYNTLTTARGEQSPYPLVLADGTRVWLNAESSLTFPAHFSGSERKVSLTGEAYFEVTHNAVHPFKVETEKQTIEDIGTSFDVNAYTDEPRTQTTLIEGSVKAGGVILKPGQRTDGVTVHSIDPQTVIAWKNGQFRFDKEPLEEIMRQAKRWYNIEVIYDDANLRNETFGGITTRFANISELLRTLELTRQVRFTIQDRKITVHSY